ncbi:hypothetical protein I79_007109 [Cricetulus griseus]|uniref:Uncharacterized protein n=1 Tax=Cricetulus griseus TaxID=10029 RepID=G3H9N2_CRIGR|nr:hypothetical protein I79_007109 [Cricetulus griseus]
MTPSRGPNYFPPDDTFLNPCLLGRGIPSSNSTGAYGEVTNDVFLMKQCYFQQCSHLRELRALFGSWFKQKSLKCFQDNYKLDRF